LLSEVANRAVSCKPLKGFNEARALLSAMLFGGNTPFQSQRKVYSSSGSAMAAPISPLDIAKLSLSLLFAPPD
jgi:hypothetical protein